MSYKTNQLTIFCSTDTSLLDNLITPRVDDIKTIELVSINLFNKSDSIENQLNKYLTLKNVGKYKNKILRVAYPEDRLHCSKHRLVTRQIVRLINKGFTIELFTHSDYVIREINTLILLNRDNERTGEVRKKYKSQGLLKTDRLDYTKLSLYELSINQDLDKVFFYEAEVTEDGVEVNSIDKVLNEINMIKDYLYRGK